MAAASFNLIGGSSSDHSQCKELANLSSLKPLEHIGHTVKGLTHNRRPRN
jgi:hypothetical protein